MNQTNNETKREPTISEALEGFSALPAVLTSLEQIQKRMQEMQNEIAALRNVSGAGDGENAPDYVA